MGNEKDKKIIRFTENDQIDRLLNRVVNEVRDFTQAQVDQIRTLNQIGLALSAEKNIDRLLEMIVEEARKLVNADGGTLYIMNDAGSELSFASVQNETLDIRMGGTSGRRR